MVPPIGGSRHATVAKPAEAVEGIPWRSHGLHDRAARGRIAEAVAYNFYDYSSFCRGVPWGATGLGM